jgi:hypothetical protein
MDCKQCEALLTRYEQGVVQYSAAIRRLAGLLGDDFENMHAEAEELLNISRAAWEELMSHWRSEHKPVPPALASGDPLC